MNTKHCSTLVAAIFALQSTTIFAVANDTVASASRATNGVSASSGEMNPEENVSTMSTGTKASEMSDKPDCFCCPCEDAPSRSSRTRRTARLSVGTSGIQVQWDVTFSFLALIAVLCGTWIIRKLLHTMQKTPPLLKRLKVYFILRALVDTLDRTIGKFNIEHEGSYTGADFAQSWTDCLSDHETFKALLGLPRSPRPGEVLSEELLRLSVEFEALFDETQFLFKGKTIAEGIASIYEQMRFYGDECRKLNCGEDHSMFTGKNVYDIKDAIEKGRMALALMERDLIAITR